MLVIDLCFRNSGVFDFSVPLGIEQRVRPHGRGILSSVGELTHQLCHSYRVSLCHIEIAEHNRFERDKPSLVPIDQPISIVHGAGVWILASHFDDMVPPDKNSSLR